MKRSSKRASRRVSARRSSGRRTSRRLVSNRSVEHRRFGREVANPDKIGGNAGRELDGAMSRYEIFQQKPPQAVVRITHSPPKLVVPVGDAISVMYRSSKWTKPGEEEIDVDYKHRHEASEGREYAARRGVRVYENAKFSSPKFKEQFGTETLSIPEASAWARLGYCLGYFVRRDDDGEIYEANPRNTWLLSSPDGHMLAVYSPRPQSNGDVGFLCLLAGGKLRVLKEGIDG